MSDANYTDVPELEEAYRFGGPQGEEDDSVSL